MNLDWILSPLTQFAALAVGLIACLALFISTKTEVTRLRRRHVLPEQPPPVDIAPLAEEIDRLNQAVRALEQAPSPVPAPGLNLTRRTQVIRMHHRGEPISTIAAALQVPTGEIELMLKVHQLTQINSRQTG